MPLSTNDVRRAEGLPELKPKTVKLELNESEAHALAALLGKVGGSPEYSARKHLDSASRKLERLGYDWTRSIYRGRAQGALSFGNQVTKGHFRSLLDSSEIKWFDTEPTDPWKWEPVTLAEPKP